MDSEHLSPIEAFSLAVTRAGSQSALAKICGCTTGNINQLLKKKSPLPGEYVLKVEAATNVSRYYLRPDIYPRGLQDGVPFSPDDGAGLGDLASRAAPEWPLPPRDDDSSCDRSPELQRPAA